VVITIRQPEIIGTTKRAAGTSGGSFDFHGSVHIEIIFVLFFD
jgi:hypothetical protein